jgi:hypothetical protein
MSVPPASSVSIQRNRISLMGPMSPIRLRTLQLSTNPALCPAHTLLAPRFSLIAPKLITDILITDYLPPDLSNTHRVKAAAQPAFSRVISPLTVRQIFLLFWFRSSTGNKASGKF